MSPVFDGQIEAVWRLIRPILVRGKLDRGHSAIVVWCCRREEIGGPSSAAEESIAAKAVGVFPVGETVAGEVGD